MTQNYHTPLGVGDGLTASGLNDRLSNLDSGITAAEAALNVLGTKGDLLTRTSSANVALGAGSNGTLLSANSGATEGLEWVEAPLPQGYVSGFEVDVASGTITIRPGVARSDDNTTNLKRTSGAGNITINPATSGAGGIDTGSLANSTWYRVFVIYNPTSELIAGLISTSSSPTMPSGYTKKRRVGWARTNGSAALYQQATIDSGQRRQVQWLEDTTTGDFRVLNGDVSDASWDTVTLTAVCPPTSRMAQIYASRNAAGGLVRHRINANMVANVIRTSTPSALVMLSMTGSQTFELNSATAGNEALELQVQAYMDDLAVSSYV